MAFFSALLRFAVRASMGMLVTSCSLSVLEGLTGGGKADGGSPNGSEPPGDAGRETAATDAPGAPIDGPPDRFADTSEGADANLDGGHDSDWDGQDDPDDSAAVDPDVAVSDGAADMADPDAAVSDDAADMADPGDADATVGDVDRDGDGRIVCGCPGDAYCANGECVYTSCRSRLSALPGTPSGVALIDPDGDGDGGEPAFRAYCEMVADGGGWTLVLKVDGTGTRFLNHASLWENDLTYRPEYPDLDANEAKLASYSSIDLTSVRVGMLQNGTTRWLVVPAAAASFGDLMRGGYRPTTLGRGAWKSLSATGSLQSFCGREGFNVTTPAQAAVRIGIIGNDYDNCTSCDSWIGFGGELMGLGYACGNVAGWYPDNGDRDLPLFGYVMVR